MEQLIILRHGQTSHNATGRLQGHLDTELSDDGVRQAVTAAESLADRYRIRAVISSDLRRAAQTATPLAMRTGATLSVDGRLRELHHGQWQGLTWTEIEKSYPGELERWRSDGDTRMPDGESRVSTFERISPLIEEQESMGNEGLALVTHGSAAIAIGAGLLKLQPSAWTLLAGMNNCHWAHLVKAPVGWRLAGYNLS